MEWKEGKLGNVLEVKYGKDHKKLQDGEYPVYGSGGLMRYADSTLYDGPSILIPRKGTLNNIMFVENPFWTVDTMFWTKINKEKVDPKFLFYSICKKDFASMNVGSAVPSMTVNILNEIDISYPKELSDQRRIASLLSSLDRKIETNNKINAKLEEMAQAIFKNWFVDFEPFKDGKFKDSELGRIPEGWEVGSPYKYVKVIYGAPYKSSLFNDKGEGFPLIRIRDLKECKPQFYTSEELPQTEYVNRGEILAGMDAEFTPRIWKGEKGVLNQRVCKLAPQLPSISSLFVLYLMKTELEFVQSYKTGTTVSHLGKADIDKFCVILPPIRIVEECSKLLNSILLRMNCLAEETFHLGDLRDTLLPRLMSGEIEIPE